MVTCCYAIIPDGTAEPAALFEDLEDAVDWGLHRYGNDTFRIRYVEVTPIEMDDCQTKRAV
jgi:hypothetical protein